VVWAKARKSGGSGKEDRGLSVRFDEHRDTAWTLDEASGNAVRSEPRASEQEIQVCAQCHARRGQIADGYAAGKTFFDYYRPALLTPPLYYPDGQQRSEVYEWGSFLQSKMYASGVTCSDCHEPHRGKLRAEGNAVCAQCHAAAKYDTASHHRHAPGTSAARCVGCHMPDRTYMVIDPRRDHSLRVPRPDLSIQLGTPNACNGCHTERDARWAAQQLMEWYGHEPQGYQRFAEALSAQAGTIDANAQLRAVAGDATQPAIARATALANLTIAARGVIAKALRDPNPLVRFGALESIARASADDRVALGAPLLSDPVRMVRIEAAALLADVAPARFSTKARAAFERAAEEYVASQRYNADRADARANLGMFYAKRGDAAAAERELEAAIRPDPFFVPAYVNLADLYRALGRDAEGEAILRKGLEAVPASAPLHHALGLVLVRLKRRGEALTELSKAAALEPADARFVYVHAVALHSAGKVKEAIARLDEALRVHPEDRDMLAALVAFHRAAGGDQAEKYAERLRALNEKMTQAR
jgi:predicted CXXCH cytochrome family protein